MKTAIVIPARYQSSRLPGKMLLRDTGKYLIQHVYERARQTRCADLVLVATDDPLIANAVRGFGGELMWTSQNHRNGTDRVAEVAAALRCDVVINLQGDEPLVDPSSLDLLATMMERNTQAMMATLATPIRTMDQWRNPNCVKVVCAEDGRALYFSRSPIPHVRDGQPDFQADPPRFLQHIGLYAYRRSFLLHLAELPPEPLEEIESLEQLRVLAAGYGIQVGIVRKGSLGVDTRDDYDRFVQLMRLAPARAAA